MSQLNFFTFTNSVQLGPLSFTLTLSAGQRGPNRGETEVGDQEPSGGDRRSR